MPVVHGGEGRERGETVRRATVLKKEMAQELKERAWIFGEQRTLGSRK